MGIPQTAAQDQQALQKILLACLTILYSQNGFQTFQQGIQREGDIVDVIASEAGGLIKIVDQRANNNLPKNIIPVVGMMLVIEIAKFLNESGKAQVSGEQVKAAIQRMLQLLEQAYQGVFENEQAETPQQEQQEPTQEPNEPQGLLSRGGM